MPNRHVFITRRLPGTAVERLAREASVDLWEHDEPPTYDALTQRAAAADAIVCLLTDRIDAALLDAATRVRVVSNVAVGYDNIDIAAATTRGVPIGNTPGVLTETTADLAFALILAAARRITQADRFVRDGRWTTWDPNLLLGADVHGATLGIVGFGKIGQAVARRARGFDMRVLYASRSETPDTSGATRVELDDLLRSADFVSLHAPLTDATRNIIGERELRLMKLTAILINTARGDLIDQPALVKALEDRTIAAAALDVAAVEPVPPDDPLLRAPNLTLLPHIGSASHATRAKMADMAIDNCLAGLRGEPLPNCVNPDAYEGERWRAFAR